MNINIYPPDIRRTLRQALDDLCIDEDKLDFWEVSDYGINVILTEQFYQTLNYRRADPIDFMARTISGNLPFKNSYKDSRSLTKPIISHFVECGINPSIIDVGGYIGRFSLESALLLQQDDWDIPIYCLEPGLTINIIKANLQLNGVASCVDILALAASDTNSTAEYKYVPHALISGRICSFPSSSKHKIVNTVRLDSLCERIHCAGAIIKIDTEGHESSVMAGLGQLVQSMPIVCIVEFWPDSLKETVNGATYADYIEDNFHVFNIRSSLYPRDISAVLSIRAFAETYNFQEGNVDLLFVPRSLPDVHRLIAQLNNIFR